MAHLPFTGAVREARVSAEEGPSQCASRFLILKSPLSDWHADSGSETRGHRQGLLRAAVTARPQTALPVATAQGHWVQSQILAQISQDRQDQALLQHPGALWTYKLAAAQELNLKFELCL